MAGRRIGTKQIQQTTLKPSHFKSLHNSQRFQLCPALKIEGTECSNTAVGLVATCCKLRSKLGRSFSSQDII
jgi:hypothetical protein